MWPDFDGLGNIRKIDKYFRDPEHSEKYLAERLDEVFEGLLNLAQEFFFEEG
jgi:hypothetical protein